MITDTPPRPNHCSAPYHHRQTIDPDDEPCEFTRPYSLRYCSPVERDPLLTAAVGT
jgi:hypothetical protein